MQESHRALMSILRKGFTALGAQYHGNFKILDPTPHNLCLCRDILKNKILLSQFFLLTLTR